MSSEPQTESFAEKEFKDGMRTSEPLFENIDGSQQITEIQSLCMNCEQEGITKLLLTKIPHFKEIVLMAFECPHCGFKNNEIQSASVIAEMGMRQSLKVSGQKDLSRQVVKGEHGTIRFEELDFEIPPNSQRGVLSTIDGILDRAIEGLNQDQVLRRIQHPELAVQIDKTIEILQSYYDNKTEFTITLDDPSGNSYIENIFAPKPDPKMVVKHYKRTAKQDEELGLAKQEEVAAQVPEVAEEEFPLDNQVHVFPGNCSRCNAPSETRMHMLDIPHFKQVIIMATDCEACGFKSNEVKAGGAVSEKGQRISLVMTEMDDLSRDILKSESCGLKIPEIGLELTTGTLGGRFTTVEGLLTQVHDELEGRSNFLTGDSTTAESKNEFKGFLAKLKSVLNGEAFPVTLILNDPLANSHLQNPYAPDPDPNMTIIDYERSYEDNENYGLNDIKTDDY